MDDKILHNLTDNEVLFLTLIGEARGEPIEGIVGVGCVIRNRLHYSPARYKGYKDVCLAPFQFSCWNADDDNSGLLLDIANKLINNQIINDPYLRQCFVVSNAIAEWSLLDNVKGARYYMTSILFESDKRPSWAKSPVFTLIRGNHTFFNL